MSEEIDYGPLNELIGVWKGDKGIDVAPDKDDTKGTVDNPYYETITFDAIGTANNAKKQTLAVLHYLQVVTRIGGHVVL